MINKDNFYKINNGAGAKAVAEGLLKNVEILADEVNSIDNTSRIVRLDGYSETSTPKGVFIHTRQGVMIAPDDWIGDMDADGIIVSNGTNVTLFSLDISKDVLSYGEYVDNNEIENITDVESARKDMNGAKNTSIMDDSYIAGSYCKSTGGYLPSSGQLYTAITYIAEINKAFEAIGMAAIGNNDVFWSSSEKDERVAWSVSANGATMVETDKSIELKVWPAKKYESYKLLNDSDSLNKALWKLSESISALRVDIDVIKEFIEKID